MFFCTFGHARAKLADSHGYNLDQRISQRTKFHPIQARMTEFLLSLLLGQWLCLLKGTIRSYDGYKIILLDIIKISNLTIIYYIK